MKKPEIIYPNGAIQTMAQLEGLVAKAKAGEKVIIYEIINDGPVYLYQNELGKKAKLVIDPYNKETKTIMVGSSINGYSRDEATTEIALEWFNLDDVYADGKTFLFTNYLLARSHYLRLKAAGAENEEA